MKTRSKRLALALAVLVVVLAGGIASHEARAEDLSGVWAGRWSSDSTGHQGPMRATFTRIDDSHYLAEFRGRFFKVFPFRYSVVLNVIQEGDVVELSGQNYLGRLFGTFTYQATATGCKFQASYRSCKDCGQFVMTRCCRFIACQ